jgi:hypothetical protein
MESHIIYSASSHMKHKAIWSDWIYCGVGNDLKRDVIVNAINELLKDSTLYFVNTRKDSTKISKMNILERIGTDLDKHDLFIWDAHFEKVIELNKIGVMRSGFVPVRV